MKKILLVVLFLIAMVGVAACKDTPENEGVVITYAAWNLGTEEDYNIERRMIDEFMIAYPDITVEVIERPKTVDEEGNESDVSWDEFFAAQAAIGQMPDVFMSDSVIKAVTNGWAEDIMSIASADEEYALLSQDIRDAASINGKLYALPQALYYMGYFINRTVINEAGAGAITPTYGISYEDLMIAAEADAKQPVIGGDGIAGIDGVSNIIGWLPAQYDADIDWFTYSEDGFNFDSVAFELAVNEQNKYFGAGASGYSNYVLETQDNTADRYGEGSPFTNGKQSIKWEGSYNLRDWLSSTLDEESGLYGADIDFIGTPSVTYNGVTNHRIPVVLDYIGIGQGTDHPEEAYEFAKWMGFGKDGYLERLNIAENHPDAGAVNFAPMINDDAIVDAFFDLYPTLYEFKKIVTQHEDFIIESLAKTVPGYVEVRWTASYNADTTMAAIFDSIVAGDVSLADALAAGLNTIANREYNEAKDRLDAITES
jgi:ABC-type glycerol-3-phosphate transport system substrate-binding protein